MTKDMEHWTPTFRRFNNHSNISDFAPLDEFWKCRYFHEGNNEIMCIVGSKNCRKWYKKIATYSTDKHHHLTVWLKPRY